MNAGVHEEARKGAMGRSEGASAVASTVASHRATRDGRARCMHGEGDWEAGQISARDEQLDLVHRAVDDPPGSD